MATVTVRPQPSRPGGGGGGGSAIAQLMLEERKREANKERMKQLGIALSDDSVDPMDVVRNIAVATGDLSDAVAMGRFVEEVRRTRAEAKARKEEAETQREFEAGESEKDREFRERQAKERRQFEAGESKKQRGFQAGQAETKRSFEAGESEKQRRFQAGESETKRRFEASESEKQRGFQAGESEIKRDFEAGESRKDRLAQEALVGLKGEQTRKTKEAEINLAEEVRKARQEATQGAMNRAADYLESQGEGMAANIIRSLGAVEPGLASTTLQTTAEKDKTSREVKGRDIEVFRRNQKGEVESRKVTLKAGESVSTFDKDPRFEELRQAGFSAVEPAEADDPELKKHQMQLRSATERTGLSEAGAQFFADNEKAVTQRIMDNYARFDPESKKLVYDEGRIGQRKMEQALAAVPKVARQIESGGGSLTLPTLTSGAVRAVNRMWDTGKIIPEKLRTAEGPEAVKQMKSYLTREQGLTTFEAEGYLEELMNRGLINIKQEDLLPGTGR